MDSKRSGRATSGFAPRGSGRLGTFRKVVKCGKQKGRSLLWRRVGQILRFAPLPHDKGFFTRVTTCVQFDRHSAANTPDNLTLRRQARRRATGV